MVRVIWPWESTAAETLTFESLSLAIETQHGIIRKTEQIALQFTFEW